MQQIYVETIDVLRVSDSIAINSIFLIAKEFTDATSRIALKLNYLYGEPQSFSTCEEMEGNARLRQILDCNSMVLKVLVLDITMGRYQYTVRLNREWQDPQYPQKKQLHDKVEVQCHSNPQNSGIELSIEYAKLVARVRELFHPIETASFLNAFSEQAKSLLQSQMSEVEHLKNQQREFFSSGQKFILGIAEKYSSIQDSVDKKFEERRIELHEQQGAMEKEFQARVKIFEAEKSSFDTRENRHVRRNIFDKISEKIKKRQVELRTNQIVINMRWPIRIALLVLLAILGIGAYYYYIYISVYDGKEIRWLDFSARIGLTVIFLSLSTYYIRWENSWASRHADEEFRIKRFVFDLDRANYLAELAMEWKQSTGSEMPVELISRMSANLFVDSTSIDENDHPASVMMATLFGQASQAKIKLPGGHELDFNRKAIERLANSAGGEERK